MGKGKDKHPWVKDLSCKIDLNVHKKLQETAKKVRGQLEARKKDPCIQDLVKIVKDTEERAYELASGSENYVQFIDHYRSKAYEKIKNALKQYSCL